MSIKSENQDLPAHLLLGVVEEIAKLIFEKVLSVKGQRAIFMLFSMCGCRHN